MLNSIAFFLLMTLVSLGGKASDTKKPTPTLGGCEIEVKQLKKHPFLIK